MSLNSFKGRERRAYVRLESSLPVRFKIVAEQKGKTYTATTKNISDYIVEEVVQRYEEP